MHLALLAYNRGEDAVWRDVKAGVNPGNGYDRFVMRDYKGKGRIDDRCQERCSEKGAAMRRPFLLS